MAAINEARELSKKMNDAHGVSMVKFKKLVEQAFQEGYELGCRETKDGMARQLGLK